MLKQPVTISPDILHKTLDILGDSSKKALLHYLDSEYGIRVFGAEPISIEELKKALNSMFGQAGCDLLIQNLYKEILYC